MDISGFTFVHNAIESGYPIAEAINAVKPYVNNVVVVECESTDETKSVLTSLGVDIISGAWGDCSGDTLLNAHALNNLCPHELIIHFEADEVYDDQLLQRIKTEINNGVQDISVYRIQLEQNFQRCRWYPLQVHRVFPKGSVTKNGHTTHERDRAKVLGPECGMLYDITNCFRDNWWARTNNQKKLWQLTNSSYTMVPNHANKSAAMSADEVAAVMNEPHWEWAVSPFRLPKILEPLVGTTKYAVRLQE